MGSSKYPPTPPLTGGTPSLPGQGQPKQLQPGEYGPVSSPTIATFNVKDIPPNGLYVTRNDVLSITVQNVTGGSANVDVHYRLQLVSPTSTVPGQPDTSPTAPYHPSPISNTTVAATQSFALTATRAQQSFNIPMQEGFLTVVSLGISPAIAKKGQCYARVILQRGDSFTGGQSGQLICGYITSFTGLNWPGPGPNYSVDGAGWLNSVSVGNPAAGADFSINVPAGARWRIRSVQAILTTSVTVATRNIRSQVRDGSGNLLFQAGTTQTVAASNAVQVNICPSNISIITDTGSLNAPLPPDLIVPAGFSVGVGTFNLQAADQWSNIWYYVEEWSEN